MILEKEKYSFEYSIVDEKISIDRCIWNGATKIIFPSFIDNKPVFKINNECFKILDENIFWDYLVEEIEIEEGIEEIGDYAFVDLIELKKIHIPSSVNKIGKYIFDGCTTLNSEIELIDINENNLIYSSCNNSNIILEKNTGSLLYAFSTSKLESNNIKIIKSGAFRNLYNLKRIDVPEGCVIIEENAIDNCSNLECLTIPSTTKEAYNSINSCFDLSSVSISSNNKYIVFDRESNNFYPLEQEFTKLPLTSFNFNIQYLDDKKGEYLSLSYSDIVNKITIENGHDNKTTIDATDYKEALSDLCFLAGYTKENLNSNNNLFGKRGYYSIPSKIRISINTKDYSNDNIVINDQNKYIKLISILEFISPYKIDLIRDIPNIKYSIDDINIKYMTIPDLYIDMYKTYETVNCGKKHPNDGTPIFLNTNFINSKKNLEYLKIRKEDVDFDESILDNLKNIKHIIVEENIDDNSKIYIDNNEAF